MPTGGHLGDERKVVSRSRTTLDCSPRCRARLIRLGQFDLEISGYRCAKKYSCNDCMARILRSLVSA